MRVNRQCALASITLIVAGLIAWFGLYLLERGYRDDGPNYAMIELGLFVGGNVIKPPPATSAVLNLCESDDPLSLRISPLGAHA
jgi:hypothetical protein